MILSACQFLMTACICFGPIVTTHQATGVKVGEVSQDSAIIWMRVTEDMARKAKGVVMKGRATFPPPSEAVRPERLIHACPGAPGKVRVRYGTKPNLSDAKSTDWVAVTDKTDFTHQFRLTGLTPATTYYFSAETVGEDRSVKHAPLSGSFETAPPPDRYGDVTFTVITGMAYRDVDHRDGFLIYPSMGKLKPEFIVPTGDTVYYDNDKPLANTPALARYHWHRIYGMPHVIDFHRHSAGYWMKDDHDTFCNDCWPGMATKKARMMRPLTFERGQQLFLEQVPMGERTYRTYRWGKGLQVWLVEGRDFRSPNPMPDGPNKTIWGTKQKAWLKQTILASDADWKVLLTPTPIVGPDRKRKADNHANEAFAHEGNEIRQWIQQHAAKNLFVVCGDRHWQYVSVDPKTGVREFSCGPASDQHAGGVPKDSINEYEWVRVKGGFLAVQSWRDGNKSRIAFRHYDVPGNVVHEKVFSVPAR